MLFDEEISFGWCLGLSWRCTPFEALGYFSVILFYTSMLIISAIHIAMIRGHDEISTGNQSATRRQASTTSNDDLGFLISLLICFFTFAAGCLLWVLNQLWVHPLQIWQVQLLGSAMLIACLFLFVTVHTDLGDSWNPIPDTPPMLVTHGVFQFARHPMHAIFLWAAIAALLATLNWVIAWCVFGVVMVTLRRIKTEECILVEVFGDRYVEYQRHVSALGPPWQCLGFDGEMRMAASQHRRGDYNVID